MSERIEGVLYLDDLDEAIHHLRARSESLVEFGTAESMTEGQRVARVASRLSKIAYDLEREGATERRIT